MSLSRIALIAVLLSIGCVDGTGGDRDDDDALDDDDDDDDALIDRLREALQSGDGEVIEALWREAAAGDGVPVEGSGRWLFLTWWADAPGGVALVGDINGWLPTSHVAAGPTADGWYWVELAEEELEVSAAGAKYKWYGASDVYRAPPETTAYGFDENGRHGWVRPPTNASWMEQLPLISEHLETPRALRARLPAGFEPGSTAAARFRTLLMHDGQNVMHPDAPWGGWGVHETLAAGTPDVVLLAIDNTPDRFDAYTQVADDFGEGLIGGRADDHLALVQLEALPYLRARYGIEAEGASLMVAGSSLGGLFALYSAAAAPDLQGCVGALSPTLGWGAFAADGSRALANSWPGDVGHGSVSVYLDSGGGVSGTCADGDGDGIFEDADSSDNYCTTTQLRDVLDDLGYTFGVDLAHWHEPDAPHNEAAWRDRFWRALAHCSDTVWRAPAR